MTIAEEIANDIWNNRQFKLDVLKLIETSLRHDYKDIINPIDMSVNNLDRSLQG